MPYRISPLYEIQLLLASIFFLQSTGRYFSDSALHQTMTNRPRSYDVCPPAIYLALETEK